MKSLQNNMQPLTDQSTQQEGRLAVNANQEAAAKLGVVIPGSTTPAQAYKQANLGEGDPYATALGTQAGKALQVANEPIDETAIYRNKLGLFQGEIDAVNKIYQEKLAQQITQGQGNLGTGRAIQARSGTLGSDFGVAQTADITRQNTNQEDLVRAELAAKIGAIMGTVRGDVATELAAKREAQRAGSQDYLTYLGSQSERKTSNTQKLASLLLDQGLTPDQIDPAQLKQAASSYGVSVQDILGAYASEKKTRDAALQDSQFNLSEGQARFDADGNLIASRAKTYAPSSGNGGGLTRYQQFSATQSLAKDTQARTANARELSRQATMIDNAYNNIVSGKNRSLNTQVIVTSFNKILDPTSVVRESEYDRTAAGQALIAQLEGKVQNIAQGGAGVTNVTLKEASDIAKQYIQGANASILAENARSQQIADSFGLNSDFVGSVGGQSGGSNPNDPLGLFGEQ